MARNCKYHKIETKVSYDDGQTWESKTPPVYHMGGLIEAYSQDCETGTTLERWITVEGDYLCDGNNKWTKQLLQNSYDGGVTWYASAPTTFRLGEFIEVDEEYCLYASEAHYIVPDVDYDEMCALYLHCPQWYKPTYSLGSCYCRYIDPIKVVKCSTDTITENYLSNGKYFLSALKLGECARIVSIDIQSTFASQYMQPYLTSIDTTNAVNLETISDNSFRNCSGLTSIVIPNSVVTIGNYAFQNCSAMTSVTVNDAQVAIGNSAFENCTSLSALDLGNSAVTIGSSAFRDCTSLTSIDIPSGVTSIGDGAFYNCSSLTEAIIGGGSIGQIAFKNCSGLTSCTIGNGVTIIGARAFEDCISLSSLVIPSGITSIGTSAFNGCSGLTSITIEAAIPPTLHGTEVFSGTNCTIYVPCDSLYAYRNDSSWSRYNSRIRPIQPCDYQYKASVIYGGVTTYDVLCNSNSALTRAELSEGGSRTNITSVDIGNCTSSISASTFSNCYRLTNIHISSSVTSVGNNAFYGCSALSEVHIDDVAAWCNIDFTTGSNTNPIANSGKLYLNNQRVRNLSIPSGITSIGNYAFSVFTDLTSMTLSNTVSSIGNSAFYSCRNLSSVDFGSGLTSIGTSAFYRCTGLTSVELPDSITSIGESAFQNCSGATSVGIGSGITSIGASAFTNCSSLTAITVSASTPPTLEGDMDRRTFQNTNNCPIYVPCASVDAYKTTVGWNSYLTRIQGFGNCPSKLIATYSDSTVDTIDCNGDSSLSWSETKNMSNPVSSMTIADIGNCTTNINGAFNGATSLTSVTIPDSVTNIGNNAFYGCTSLTSIDIPSGVTSIGDSAFGICTSLTSIDIPNSVTNIGQSAFAYTPWWNTYSADTSHHYGNIIYINDVAYIATSTSITSATFKSETVSIGGGAFYGCTSLTSIDIPSGVTNIGDFAFRNCSSLTSCTIGSGVTSIGAWAFSNCSGLTSITVNATTPPTLANTNAFTNTNNCAILVPAASVSSYQSASGWSDYASRIQAIT